MNFKGHHGGSVKLLPTNLKDLVPLEQLQHKPMDMYDGGLQGIFKGVLVRCSNGRDEVHFSPSANLGRPPSYITIGL